MCFATAFLYALLGIPLRAPLTRYLEQIPAVIEVYPLALFIALVALFAARGYRSRRTSIAITERQILQEYVALYLRPRMILRDLRLLNAVMIMFVAFAQLKHLIPFINGRLYDSYIYAAEQWLFRGVSPTLRLQQIIGLGAAGQMSNAYILFYPVMVTSLIVLIMQRNPKLIHEYATAFTLTWLLGIFMIYALPTLGPCFYAPAEIANIPATRVLKLQQDLWSLKADVEADPHGVKGLYQISGQPSLHLAIAILGAIFLWEFCKPLGVLAWLFVAATLASTIYFGWHYLFDHLTAAVLVILSIALARRIVRYWEKASGT